jgi:HMG-box domain
MSSLSLTTSTTSSLSPDVPTTPSGSHRPRHSIVSNINEYWPKKGDEDYVKRPENAFILFRRKCHEDRNPAPCAGDAGDGDGSAPTKKLRKADLTKPTSQQWKCLSSEERQYWEDLAMEKKVRTFSLSSAPFPSVYVTVSAERARGHVSPLRLPPSAHQG